MEISRLHHPVTALGYGTRAGIWTQGCSIRCAGCVSLDTLERRPEREVPVVRILEWLAALPAGIDGVTVSGGEPTDQPGELRVLLEGLREVAARRAETWDLLVYTGRAHHAVLHRCPWLDDLADVLVTGPFVQRAPSPDPLKGSANQEVVLLSELGRTRYGGREITAPEREDEEERPFDVTVADGTVWMVGIPRRGDMDRLRTELANRGVLIEAPSWLA